MSEVSVLNYNGYTTLVEQLSIVCPFCHSKVVPKYLFLDDDRLFACCTNNLCNKRFVLSTDRFGKFINIEPNSVPQYRTFSEIIRNVSSKFVSIYNQAYHAEQVGLDQICGVGYRKSIEFLIKDYLISKENNNQNIDNIKRKFLGNCIQEDIHDRNIKEVAKRAVWLGNDETHYTRIWVDKDVNNLKQLIDLTVRWIENEVETELVLQEMDK